MTLLSNFFSKEDKSTCISSAEILNLNKKNQEEFVLIDLRTPGEITTTGIIPNALIKNYFDSDFSSFIDRLKKDRKYIVYCKAGGRSAKAAKQFKNKNLEVKDYSGGMDDWLSSGLKTLFNHS